jgi:hypothetical protein
MKVGPRAYSVWNFVDLKWYPANVRYKMSTPTHLTRAMDMRDATYIFDDDVAIGVRDRRGEGDFAWSGALARRRTVCGEREGYVVQV